MHVWVDADACSVIALIEQLAKQKSIQVTLLCDTNHRLSSDYSEIIVVGAGIDAVDFALINRCQTGDLVVTQDYGVAAMALGKSARAIHPSGSVYTDDNIGGLLMDRHLAQKARRASAKYHSTGPKKRTIADDAKFCASLERLFNEMME